MSFIKKITQTLYIKIKGNYIKKVKKMEKKTLIGLIIIVAIAAIVIFTGCIEEKAATPPPKYCKGDIITKEQESVHIIEYVILDYNKKTDKYKMNFINKGLLKNDKGNWAYLASTFYEKWDDRDFIDQYYPIKIDHVNLSTIMSDREYRNQDEYRVLLSQPKYQTGDVIMFKDHLRVILDYNKTTDMYKTTWVQDTDALGLCYLFSEESPAYAMWERREYAETHKILFVLYENVNLSKIKSSKEYYEKYGY
jgi:hypothetical protein